MFLAVPPTKAELVGYEAEEELVVREEEEVELVCRVHNARPRPDIIWYRGGEEFVSGEHHFPFFHLLGASPYSSSSSHLFLLENYCEEKFHVRSTRL